jgi:uncharacterized membrane protein YqhA
MSQSMSQSKDKPKLPLTFRLMSQSRYMVWLAVIGTFIGAMVLMLVGAIEVFGAIWNALTHLFVQSSSELKLVLIESVDTFLVAIVILLISLGLYQLFVDRDLDLPAWLDTPGVEDLEKRLAGMIIIVMAVVFLTQVLHWDGQINFLWFGLGIAAVIFAISIFLYQEARNERKNE